MDGKGSINTSEDSILLQGEKGYSGLICYKNFDKITYEQASTNTNIIFPVHNVPYGEWFLKKGKHVIGASFYASPDMTKWNERPDFTFLHNQIKVEINQEMILIKPKQYSMKQKTMMYRFRKNAISYLKKLMK